MKNGRGEQAEASQLIDIAAMAALVKPEARTHAPLLPPARNEAFATAHNFAASRLTTRSASEALAITPKRTSDPRAPLYWMIGCLNVMVLALAAYVVLDQPTVVVQAASAEATPAVAAPAAIVDAEPEPAANEIPGAPKTEPVVASSEPTEKVASGRRARQRARATAPVAETKERPTTKPPSKDVPFECIVDPASCDRGGKAPTTEAQGPRAKVPTEDLPLTLSQSALRTGFDRVRSDAKACGSKHGAAPGEKVAVKISIAGGTGKVTASSALDSHAGTALGQCVAGALKGATFDRFAKSTIGIKYTVRL